MNNGNQKARLRVATSRKYKDRDGQKQEKTTWHTIEVWGKQAEFCAQYLTKGRTVYVEGENEDQEYDGKDGTRKYVRVINASTVQALGSNKTVGGGGQNRDTQAGSFGGEPDDSDIPF